MEQRFGCDFSRVRVHTGRVPTSLDQEHRVHTGPSAEQSARDVNARAYTIGNSLVFGAGEFDPWTRQGDDCWRMS